MRNQKIIEVTIPSKAEHEGIYRVKVRLHNKCPQCDGPRGIPYESVSFDGSRRLSCDGWSNPCGHVDKYEDVLKEARANGLNVPRAKARRSLDLGR